MVGIKFNVKSAFALQLRKYFQEYKDRLVKLKTFNEAVLEYFYLIEERIFNSQGSFEGRRVWKDNNQKYLQWKYRLTGQTQVMVLTGRLFKSLTERGSENIGWASDKSVGFGTTVPYASIHQYGEEGLPERKVYSLSQKDFERIGDALKAYATGEPNWTSYLTV